MNRIKLWVFTLLVVAAGVTGLQASSGRMVARSMSNLDARLQAAAAFADVRTRLLKQETSAIAGAAARDQALVAALSPAKPPLTPPEAPRLKRGPRLRPPPLIEPTPPPAPPADPVPVADAVTRAAAQAAGIDPSRGLMTGLVRQSKIALRAGEHEVKLEGDTVSTLFLDAARDGQARETIVRVERALYHAVAMPVTPGSALVVGLPMDAEWTHAIHTATGVDVTLSVDETRTVSTLGPGETKTLIEAMKKPAGGTGAVSVGKLAPVKLFGGPAIPLLFAQAPAWRVQTMPLPGEAGTVLLSRSTRSYLEPIAQEQQVALVGLAVVLLVGILLGFLVKNEPPLAIPKELLSAADRIARGDYDVRAPALVGQLGTLADALNRAAEAAASKTEIHHQAGVGMPLPQPPPQPEPEPLPEAAPLTAEEPPPADPFLRAAPAPSGFDGETTARDFMSEPSRATALFSAPAEAGTYGEGEENFAGPEQYAQPPETAEPLEPLPEQSQASSLEPLPSGISSAFIEPLAPPPTPEPSPEEGDEEHWRQVFEEFLLIRRQCGEPADGLTYEKFRLKLQKNRDSLIEKYGCKAVRFQAYMKDGKAALKATPVR